MLKLPVFVSSIISLNLPYSYKIIFIFVFVQNSTSLQYLLAPMASWLPLLSSPDNRFALCVETPRIYERISFQDFDSSTEIEQRVISCLPGYGSPSIELVLLLPASKENLVDKMK